MSDATRRLADELTDDELDTLVEMVQARNEGRLTRREVVKSGGLLAALGLGGGAAVGSASADASTSDNDGNIGEPGNRVDAFLDGVDASQAEIGASAGASGVLPTSRPEVLESATTVTVNPSGGADYTSVQAAVNDNVAHRFKDQLTIDLQDGAYSEDVILPPLTIGDSIDATEGPATAVNIEGNGTTPANVTGLSFVAVAPSGIQAYNIAAVTIDRVPTYIDEDAGISTFGGHVGVYNCEFNLPTGARNIGVLSYGGFVKVDDLDFGTDGADVAYSTKHNGLLLQGNTGSVGSVTESVALAYSGQIELRGGAPTAPTTRFPTATQSGTIKTTGGLAQSLTQDTFSDLQEAQGNDITVSSGAYQTVLNPSSSVTVLGGTIVGPNIGFVRVTWEDGSTTGFADTTVGDDAAGNQFQTTAVPPIEDVAQLEFRNDDPSSAEFGYNVYYK